MSKDTKIEWCHHTFNPWWGCSKISEACRNCYAETFAKRTGKDFTQRVKTKGPWRDVIKWDTAVGKRDQAAGDCGRIRERVFVGSMCDIAEDHPDVKTWQGQALELLAGLHHLDVLLLTKRPENLRKLLHRHWTHGRLPDHFWVGCTVEDQATADERIPQLLQIPAAVRFLSVEPILDTVDISAGYWHQDRDGGDRMGQADSIHWVICGGESGPRARCPHPVTVRKLRDQCQYAAIPFLFKQWGEWAPYRWHGQPTRAGDVVAVSDGQMMTIGSAGQMPATTRRFDILRKVGKHRAGRELDGKIWDQYPISKLLMAKQGEPRPDQPEQQNLLGFMDDMKTRMQGGAE